LPWVYETAQVQPYLYNGKEFVEIGGLDEYDSQFRYYYPALVRTDTPDPHAENYYSVSPYSWCGGNYVSRIDLAIKTFMKI
jgi:RHS repeat-associated protein